MSLRARGATSRLLVAGILSICTGCALLPWPERAISGGSVRLPDGRLDLRGVVHVHTESSHDAGGSVDELVRAAREAGIAWVALTEHTRPGGPPPSGTRGDVILIPGYELRAWGGSLLALGIDALPATYRDPIRAIEAIHAAGGIALVAHLDVSRVTADEWNAAQPDGLEIANLHAAAAERGVLRLASASALFPAPWVLRTLLRTPAEDLERWELLPDADAIVSGSDAHSKLSPIPGLRPLDSYSRFFRLLTTHVVTRSADRAAILEALRTGQSYVAFEGRSRVDHFRFELEGDQASIRAPRPARLALVCDGERQELGEALEVRAAIPRGATRCRAEAWLGRELWIVTSYRRLR